MSHISPSDGTRCYLAVRLQGKEDNGLFPVSQGRPHSHTASDAPLMDSRELEHATLHLLAANQGPLGSGALVEQLQDLGYRGSEPTVGRFLRTLDRRGITARVSNRGRDMTDSGHRRLQQLCEAEAQLYYERELIRTIRTATIDDILHVLVARRALERETARLAAEHATPEEIAQLEEAIREQREALATSGVAIDADVKFHSLVAQAGRNRVLMAAIDLIRRDQQLTVVLDAILKETEHKWVVGHDQILKAIRRRAPEEAERAMLEHLNVLIADVRRYRERLGPAPSPATTARPAPATAGRGNMRRLKGKT